MTRKKNVNALSVLQNGSHHSWMLQQQHLRHGQEIISSPFFHKTSSSSSLFTSSSPGEIDGTTSTTTNPRKEPTSSSALPSTTIATRAIFISSFTDGIQNSPHTKSFFHYALLSSMVSKLTKQKEDELQNSALASPCNGPNVDVLNELEELDNVLVDSSSSSEKNKDYSMLAEEMWNKLRSSSLETSVVPTIKFLYIPTAMYALRADSQNTPGKQRQRARADGKKRRSVIIKEVQELFGSDVQVLAITLDLDDGSVKQPVGFDDDSLFPKNGKDAFQSWLPHLVYVEGGNTFWLQHCIAKGNWSNDIIAACTGFDAAVYCGKSAGAISAGALVETATWKGWDDPSIVPGMETYQDWKSIPGLSLAGESVSFFPHMSDEWNDLSKQKIKELNEDNEQSSSSKAIVYCLEENDAFCIDQSHNDAFLTSEMAQ